MLDMRLTPSPIPWQLLAGPYVERFATVTKANVPYLVIQYMRRGYRNARRFRMNCRQASQPSH